MVHSFQIQYISYVIQALEDIIVLISLVTWGNIIISKFLLQMF